MQDKNNIMRMYILELIIITFSLLCGIIGVVFTILYNSTFLEIDFFGIVIFIGSVIGFSLLGIFAVKEFIPLLRDCKDLRKGNFKIAYGKVVGFQKNRDPDSGRQINSRPIIQIEGKSDTIVLKVNANLEVGKKYGFEYLKHSKIAQIYETFDH